MSFFPFVHKWTACMRRFFTSDFHLGSERIIAACNRPFASTSEMTDALVSSCNELAGEEDVIYHIGDLFCYGSDSGYGGSEVSWRDVSRRFKATIFPLSGNHDENNGVKTLATSMRIILGKRFKCVLCHYPSYDRRASEFLIEGDINICGHAHNFWQNDKRYYFDKERKVLNINVGIDVWGYKPISEVTLANYITHLIAFLSKTAYFNKLKRNANKTGIGTK